MKRLHHALLLVLIASPFLCGADGIAATRLQVNYLDAPIGLNGSHVPAAPNISIQDVTERVQQLVNNGQRTIPVLTGAVVPDGRDPAPGKVKTLNVAYTMDGTPGTTAAQEGQQLHVGTTGGTLVITKAVYGSTDIEPSGSLRFGWVVSANRRGVRQSAYRIRVATRRDVLTRDIGDVWDSGRVNSTLQNGIQFAGKPLVGKTAYWWQVQIWDDSGTAGAWSDIATFETGILHPDKDWCGTSVCGTDPRDQRSFNYIRRSFVIPADKTITRARAFVAGDTKTRSYWDFHVNGRRADDTVTMRRGGYFSLDVTPALTPGENVVGVVFGDDNAKDMTVKIWRCDVDVWFADDTHITFGTDANCKGFRGGPIITANELDGVDYDARQETIIAGWDRPGYQDSHWLPVRVDGSRGSGQGYQSDAVRLQQTLPAVALTTPAPDVRIFDLGTNISGWPRLTVSGKPGTVVTLRCAERLKADGSLDRSSNLKGIPAAAIDRYTLKGGGNEIWEPWLTYHGFRYVEVTGDVILNQASIQGRWIHSDIIRRTTTFSCSDVLLNQLFMAFSVGERDNSMYYHTDCNQRGERAPWSADAYACSKASMALFDSADFWQRWITISNQQIGPHGEASNELRGGGGGFALFWQAQCLFIPWDFHQAYGDLTALRTSYQRAVRFADCLVNWFDTLDDNVVFDKKANRIVSNIDRHDFLIETEKPWRDPAGKHAENAMWYWGDWCHPRPKEHSMYLHTSVLASMYYFHCLDIAAQEAAILGLSEDAAKYAALAIKVKDAVNARYLAPNAYRSYSGEHAQSPDALALSIGIVPEEHRAAVAESLVADIRKRDDHLDTGLIGIIHLMRALTMTGHDDVALALARQTTFPSWGYMLLAPRAPGTLWEHWDVSVRSSRGEMAQGPSYSGREGDIPCPNRNLSPSPFLPHRPNAGNAVRLQKSVPSSANGRVAALPRQLGVQSGDSCDLRYPLGVIAWTLSQPATASLRSLKFAASTLSPSSPAYAWRSATSSS